MGLQNHLKISVSAHVSQLHCFVPALIFNALHCICFIKPVNKARKFSKEIFGVNFCMVNVFSLLLLLLFVCLFFLGGGLLEVLGVFFGFDFCPKSTIPVTGNPE